MKTQKSTRRIMVLVASTMMAVLLTACGENSTATPITVSTVGAATTSGQAISATTTGIVSPTATTASNPTIISKLDFKESDLPVYPGAKRVDALSGPQTEILSITYITADNVTAVAGWVTEAFLNKVSNKVQWWKQVRWT